MSSCADIQSLLPLFVGGDLEPALEHEVGRHLGSAGEGSARGCPACQQALDALELARRALRELPGRSPAPAIDLWPPLRERLLAEGLLSIPAARRSAAAPAARTGAGRRPLVVFVRMAAALLIGLGALFVALRAGRQAPPAPSPDPIVDAIVDSGAGPGSVAVPVTPVSLGGLRRLEPGELPLSEEAQLFVEGRQGWSQPGVPLPRSTVPRKLAPALAGDRSLR